MKNNSKKEKPRDISDGSVPEPILELCKQYLFDEIGEFELEKSITKYYNSPRKNKRKYKRNKKKRR